VYRDTLLRDAILRDAILRDAILRDGILRDGNEASASLSHESPPFTIFATRLASLASAAPFSVW
jgi:hypothetical protein